MSRADAEDVEMETIEEVEEDTPAQEDQEERKEDVEMEDSEEEKEEDAPATPQKQKSSSDAMTTPVSRTSIPTSLVSPTLPDPAIPSTPVQAPPPAKDVPRLMISKLEVENFKSYAGVREIGPFHKCFSSVVGPNGSGKSNVIDALLFVFGKRAKKLRLSKVSELIHKSSNYQNLKEARVSVYFQDIIDTGDGDEDYTVVPNSHLVVTRTANTSNQSKYFIDGRTSNFTEVTQLLRQRGIDLDNNRFLILQGEVEQIAMMKSKADNPHDEGLLEYLEDIIGSNKYVEPTEEALKQVEAFNEERVEKLNRVKVVEKEKDNLEGAKAEAQEYLEKERDVYLKTNLMFQYFVHESTSNKEECETKRDSMKTKVEKEMARMAEHRQALQTMQTEYEKVHAEYDKVKTDMEAVEAEFAEFEKRDVEVREQMKFAKKQVKDHDAAFAKEEKKQAELEAAIEENEAKQPEVEKSIEDNKKALQEAEEKLEQMIESHKGESARLRVIMEEKQSAILPYSKEVLQLRSKIDTIETEMQLTRESTTQAKEELTKAKQAIKDADKAIVDFKSKQETMETEVATMQNRLKEAKAELQEAKHQEEKINKEYQVARAKADEATYSIQSHATQNRMLKSLMTAAKKGFELEHAGLLGRLGDLGAIDAKYDVAISTACGALDHLVVETTRGAQQCVAYLRQHNLGRATFIILEKMDYLQSRCKERLNAPVPRLFDLVRVSDEKYLPAFYFALRDTLVAKHLDEATNIAYQGKQCRYRVVTLDGQMIELSGAMSGGGNRVRRGGMSSQLQSTISQDDLAALQKEAETLKSTLYNIRSARSNVEQEIRRLEDTIDANTRQIPKFAMEIDAASGRSKNLAQRVQELEKKVHLTPEETKKLKQLEKQVKTYEAECSTKQEAVDGMQSEVDKLKQQILNIGGAPLNQQRKKVGELTKEIDTQTKALTKLRVDLKTSKKALEKAQSNQIKMEKQKEENTKKLEALRKEYKEIEDKAAEVCQRHDAAKALLEEHSSVLDDKRKEFETLKKTVDGLASAEVDLLSQLEECEKLLAENEQKVVYWSGKLAELRQKYARDEEDFELLLDNPEDAKKGLPEIEPSELEKCNKEELKYEISILEQQRDELKAHVNMGSIAEYKKKEKEHAQRMQDLEQATEARDNQRRAYEELRRLRLEEFMAGFRVITLKLKEMYQMITLGGDAELELVDSLDPFSEGIVFSVRPSKKSWKNISNLSGGEKTLASLALVFALHHYKPTPLYVMDEIDAALDFKNVSIVANYIKQRTKNAQFIIISLRNNMFELADRLVGIYKTNNTTKSVTINPKHYASAAAPNEPMTPHTPMRTPHRPIPASSQ
ncbi:Structural maintenance of chromosomes protein 4 [Aphanomyces cochlioides]|nr:Structural maintenance of chromosomes protein 4 [Aphanomyces cochlioides]